ncbi:suppressor of fused domain protein [Streptomyces cyanogenus]|uniref:Suppressor of fused protein (SUFU) n=1 Tax=Streptomyces cyanogenus TaxID=80860 RepID=A0ABX7U560_STRCY|nr:suppressor of fused domain protein [Streptomyces cyanogenus]QTE03099.1 Suppressor of fused protein (SUFU) [Streptomyces cyanogenus]
MTAAAVSTAAASSPGPRTDSWAYITAGYSLPIGEPWLPGSHCDHLLISPPHLHGSCLERCPLADGHARILWVMPVTTAEMEYRRTDGHEALERLFDEYAIVPTDPRRPSVV